MHALSDPTRLAIVAHIATVDGDNCGDIGEEIDLHKCDGLAPYRADPEVRASSGTVFVNVQAQPVVRCAGTNSVRTLPDCSTRVARCHPPDGDRAIGRVSR